MTRIPPPTGHNPERTKLIKHMLSELEAPSKELTGWEDRFLESITTQWDERHWLSDDQFRTLERIYTEKTA